MANKMVALRDAYGEALVELGARRQDVVVLDADVSVSTKSAMFGAKYPDRFFNMGIAEQNLIGTAAGLASTGMVPFATTFAVFATRRAGDQVWLTVAYSNTNVKVVGGYAGLVTGWDGATHQALEDIAIMRSFPNMTVLVPSDGPSARAATLAAAEYVGPVYLRLARHTAPVIYDEPAPFKIGVANQLRDGKDVTLISTGIILSQTLQAADALAKDGISARVLDMHTIKPLDTEAVIRAAKDTGAIVTIEEHNIIGGLGSAVAETLVENAPVPMIRIGIKDAFGQSGVPEELLVHYGFTPENIADAARKTIARKK